MQNELRFNNDESVSTFLMIIEPHNDKSKRIKSIISWNI